MQTKSPLFAFAVAATTVVLWASAFPFIKIGVRSFGPVELAALRFGIASILAVGWLTWTRPKLPSLRDSAQFFLCAAIGIALYNILLNTGQTSVSPGAASFIVNTVPVMTALLAMAFLGERWSMWSWIGTGVSICGIVVIALGQPGGLKFGAGSILIVAAAGCQAVFFILQRPLVSKYGPLACACNVVLFGTVCLSPWLPGAMRQAFDVPLESFLAVVYLGVFPAAMGYAAWAIAQAHFGASRAANFLYLVPPTTLGLSFTLTSEVPALQTVIGGCAAIAGVVLVNTLGKR